MNKGGLVAEVAKRTGMGKAEVGRVVDAAIDAIRDAVVESEEGAAEIEMRLGVIRGKPDASHKMFQRLFISSLTEEEVAQGLIA